MSTAADFAQLSTDEQLARLAGVAEGALAEWPGSFADVAPIKYRENAVFSTQCDAGNRYAVRVHRHDYHSDESLAYELAWMAVLRERGLSVPHVIPNAKGKLFTRHSRPDAPGERQVDVLEWLPGAPMGTSEEGLTAKGDAAVAQMRALGRIMAQMHTLTAQWDGQKDAPRHSWDRDGLAGDMPLWGRFWEFDKLSDDDRALLIEARDVARDALDTIDYTPETYGLIHADLVPENVLVDGERLSVIDFDDSGFGWHMFDLATALQFLVDQPGYDDLRKALFEGYREQRPLSDEMEAQLPLFLFLRSSTYLGWMQTRPEVQMPDEMIEDLQGRALRLARAYLDAASAG